MGGFLNELGKKLAERWLTLLVVPGALYVGTVLAAVALGHARPFDLDRLTTWTTVGSTAGDQVQVLLVGLLAAAGAGLLAQSAGSIVEWLWLADRWQSWPRPLRWYATVRTERRRRRWLAATGTYQELLGAKAEQLARPLDRPVNLDLRLATARGATARIAQEEPHRPDWVGDRMHAVVLRLERDYRLDLATVWPHLWLVMPDSTRTAITAARESLTRATVLTGWGLLYLAAGALWWPGLLVAATVIGTGRRRARTAVDTYSLLVEAAARVHTADLAVAVGMDHAGPMDRRTGWALTCLLQGQTHLIPLTTGWPTRHGHPTAPPPE